MISQIRIQNVLLLFLLFMTVLVLQAANEAPLETEPEPTLAPQMGFPFTDNAVFQQNIKVPVWGTTLPETNVTVEFDGQSKSTLSNEKGEWEVFLDPMKAVKLKSVNDTPEVKTMTVTCVKQGKKEVKLIKNIVVGDVWVCAGQSNMAGRMKRAGHPKNYPPDSIKNANYPALRNFYKGQWQVCTPETAVWISRVTFFFARRLQKDALIPIGVITTAVGGSNIESWLNQAPYETGKNYKKLLEPFVGYGIRGAVWYQGESNEKDRRGYQPKLESLISGWRKAWNQGDFPVHFVQLPGIKKSTHDNPEGGDGRAEIRQAYVEALKLKNTGMAVTIDIGTPGEHPPNKYDTGVRLARSVLQKVYGMKIKACPIYKKHIIEGNTVRIIFDDAESGLMLAQKAEKIPEGFLPPKPTPDAKIQWLSIQDKDGKWHWAEGKIDGSDLIVSCKDVKEPIAVRYAYTTHPTGPLLYNKEGLPVGPFTTCGYGPEIKEAEKKN